MVLVSDASSSRTPITLHACCSQEEESQLPVLEGTGEINSGTEGNERELNGAENKDPPALQLSANAPSPSVPQVAISETPLPKTNVEESLTVPCSEKLS